MITLFHIPYQSVSYDFEGVNALVRGDNFVMHKIFQVPDSLTMKVFRRRDVA